MDATNKIVTADTITFHYNRKSPKRRRLMESTSGYNGTTNSSSFPSISDNGILFPEKGISEGELEKMVEKHNNRSKEVSASLANMVAVLCGQQLFLPLLRAFEIFLPSCSLLPFVRALQVLQYNTSHFLFAFFGLSQYELIVRFIGTRLNQLNHSDNPESCINFV